MLARIALVLSPSGVGDDCFLSRSPRVTRALLLWNLALAAGRVQRPPGPLRPLPLGGVVMLARIALVLSPSGVGEDCFLSRSPRVTRVLLLWDLAPAAGRRQSPPGLLRPLPLGGTVMLVRPTLVLPPSGVGDVCSLSRSPRVTRVLLLWDMALVAGWEQSPPGLPRPLPLEAVVMLAHIALVLPPSRVGDDCSLSRSPRGARGMFPAWELRRHLLPSSLAWCLALPNITHGLRPPLCCCRVLKVPSAGSHYSSQLSPAPPHLLRHLHWWRGWKLEARLSTRLLAV